VQWSEGGEEILFHFLCSFYSLDHHCWFRWCQSWWRDAYLFPFIFKLSSVSDDKGMLPSVKNTMNRIKVNEVFCCHLDECTFSLWVFIFYVYGDITVPYTTQIQIHVQAHTHQQVCVHRTIIFKFKNVPQTLPSIITAKGTVGN